MGTFSSQEQAKTHCNCDRIEHLRGLNLLDDDNYSCKPIAFPLALFIRLFGNGRMDTIQHVEIDTVATGDYEADIFFTHRNKETILFKLQDKDAFMDILWRLADECLRNRLNKKLEE